MEKEKELAQYVMSVKEAKGLIFATNPELRNNPTFRLTGCDDYSVSYRYEPSTQRTFRIEFDELTPEQLKYFKSIDVFIVDGLSKKTSESLNKRRGIDFIALHRENTLESDITVEHDVENNGNRQLVEAVCLLVTDGGKDREDNLLYEKLRIEGIPTGWDPEDWECIARQSYKYRLIEAGQMIAAEIDRISYNEK